MAGHIKPMQGRPHSGPLPADFTPDLWYNSWKENAMANRLVDCFIILLLSAGLTAGCGRHRPDAPAMAAPEVGGPCRYDDFTGTAVITRVEKTGASAAQANVAGGPGYPGYDVRFRFEPDGKPPVERDRISGEHQWRLGNGWYPGQRFLDKYGLAEGRRFPARVRLLREGTCTPLLFVLEGLNDTDYFESEPPASAADLRITYDVGGLNTLVIDGRDCRYTHAVYKGKNPVAAGTLADYEKFTTEGTIEPVETARLLTVFLENEFWRLPAELGDLDPGERYYGHTIRITLQGHTKAVMFKSNPRLTTPPAFLTIEEALQEVIRQKFGYQR
jgi:hypothetical protein